jgi:hypothetical protein
MPGLNQNRVRSEEKSRVRDLESAIVITTPLGPYTAVIHERNGQGGVGLFEAYNLQSP